MELERAERIIDAALGEARRNAFRPLGVAVLDSGGHLVAYRRENGATMLRFGIASAKAWTALGLAAPSRSFQEMAEARPQFAASLSDISGGRMAPAAGGVLVESDGRVLGAVGVSGDTPDNDERAALAGVRAAAR